MKTGFPSDLHRLRRTKRLRQRRTLPTGAATRLSIEPLEDRRLLAAFTVTSTSDSGLGSLRAAMIGANVTPNTDMDGDGIVDADRIEFDIPASDPRHFYYQNDGMAGQVTTVAVTSAANDADILDIDPDWPHSWFSIQPTSLPSHPNFSSFPNLADRVVIDGYTQPGASANTSAANSGLGLNTVLRVEIDGSVAGGSGLVVAESESTIRGLAISRFFDSAMYLYSPLSDVNDVSIRGNFLGTDVSGTVQSNQTAGVHILGHTFNQPVRNQIGGLDAADRNLISGNITGVAMVSGRDNQVVGNLIGTDRTGAAGLANGIGVSILDDRDSLVGGSVSNARNVISGNGVGVQVTSGNTLGTIMQGNYVGLDVTGTRPLGNSIGIRNEGNGTRIGGSSVGERNVISGNSHGIVFRNNAKNTVVQGNYIGTDATGLVSDPDGIPGTGDELGNSLGIQLFQVQDNLIGGPGVHEGNVISGNATGVGIGHPQNDNNLIQGNLIGVASNRTSPLGNASNGILIFGQAKNQTIGGTGFGQGNVIAHNGAAGIRVEESDTVRNPILGNSIFANGGLGIDLIHLDQFAVGVAGVTLNDVGDVDDGPNRLQNFPVLTAVTGGVVTSVDGSLNGAPGATFRVEFFSSTTADPSGFGEGQTFLGSTDVTTDQAGNASFSVNGLSGTPLGAGVTATATDSSGNTSEFSGQLTVTSIALPDLEVVSFTAPADVFLDQPFGDPMTVRIRNNGPAPTPFVASNFTGFFISIDATITTDDRPLSWVFGHEFLTTLDPGQELDIVVESTLNISSTDPDSNPPLGDVYIGYIADVNNEITEADETNNTAALPITVREYLPDLEVVSFTAPAEVFLDQPFGDQLTVRIRNNGPAPIVGELIQISTAFFISTDAAITTEDRRLRSEFGIVQGLFLAPGQELDLVVESPLNISSTFPDSIPPLGDVYIGYIADVGNQIAEADETNNTAALPITVREYLPDLEVVSFTAPAEVFLDQPFGDQLTVRIRNNGPAPTPLVASNFTGFFISTDVTITTDDRPLSWVFGHEFLTTLDPGQELDIVADSTLNFSSTDPDSNPPLGDVYIGYFADVSNQIAEADETNNTAAVPITVSGCLGDVNIDAATSQSFLDSLTHVCGSLIVYNAVGLMQLVLPNLAIIDGDFIITSNPGLSFVDAPKLTSIGGELVVENNDNLNAIEFAGLLTVLQGGVDILGNDSLVMIAAGQLTSVGGSVDVDDNDSLVMIAVGQLTSVGGSVDVDDNDSLVMIAAGQLTSVGGSVDVGDNRSLTVIDVGHLTTIDGNLTIDDNGSPTVSLARSTLTVGGAVILGNLTFVLIETILTVESSLTLGEGAEVSLDDDSRVAAPTITLQPGSKAKGNGTLVASQISNSGIIFPGSSPGKLTVDGDYRQGPEGTLVIEIGGTIPGDEYDVLDVTGTVVLEGTLIVELINGYLPQPGDNFHWLKGQSISGNFANVVLPDGYKWNGSDPSTLVARAIKNPGFSYVDANVDHFYSPLDGDVGLTAGEVEDGEFDTDDTEGPNYRKVIKGAGLVLLGPGWQREEMEYAADGDLVISTDLSAREEMELESRRGSVLLDHATLKTGEKLQIKARHDILSRHSQILGNGSEAEIQFEAGGDIQMSGTRVEAGEVDLKADQSIVINPTSTHEAVLQTTDRREGKVQLRAGADVNIEHARIVGGQRVNVSAKDSLFAALASIEAAHPSDGRVDLSTGKLMQIDGAIVLASSRVELDAVDTLFARQTQLLARGSRHSEVIVKSSGEIDLSESIVRASKKIDLHSRDGDVRLVDAELGIFCDSTSGDIDVKGDTIFIESATILAPDKIKLLGTVSGTATKMGKGTVDCP